MKDESHINLEKITIETLPVGCLTMSAFQIPKYQRGYRWKKDDVEKLLSDLDEFIKEKENGQNARSFYCLQPLVVKKSKDSENKDCWEVVDGQQRLTTLFLIWNVLNGQVPYELSYETRELSKEFLKAPRPTEDGKNQPNIDFHHIYHAHQKIEDWFNGCGECMKKKFRDLLADTNTNGRNVRFIWYRLQEDDDDGAVAAFTRLNVGKIPLTDEELIRALFLRSREAGKPADGAFQHRLALEWDRIETALQEPDFWGFVSNQPPPEGGRIRLLFQLCAPAEIKDDNHALFDHYQKKLTGELCEEPLKVWHEIVACFEQLDEWYRDPELFHLVGFRATILGNNANAALRELLLKARATTKSDFAAGMRQSIRMKLAEEKSLSTFISELSYSIGKVTRQTLALFNIATMMSTQGIKMRFPFHLYHNTRIGWDIEHVHSQAGDGLGDTKRQAAWLESCLPELKHESELLEQEDGQISAFATATLSNLIAQIDAFLQAPSKDNFPELEKKVRAHFGESETDEDELNSIGNLTLLDAPTNRNYGNAPFVVKRTEILKTERPEGTFILPCTRDLFLKVFSQNPGDLRRWDIKKDGTAHEAAICKTLEMFFGEEAGNQQ